MGLDSHRLYITLQLSYYSSYSSESIAWSMYTPYMASIEHGNARLRSVGLDEDERR
jgi:hypothetical protein